MEFWVTLGAKDSSECVVLNTREDLLDDYTYFVGQAIATPLKAGSVALHKRFLRYALMAALTYTESVVNVWLYELERRGSVSGANDLEKLPLPEKMRTVSNVANEPKDIPNFRKAKQLLNILKHFKPRKDKTAFEELSLNLVQRTYADLDGWISQMEKALAISRHPDNEQELRKLNEPVQQNVRIELTTKGKTTPEMKITVLPSDAGKSSK